MPTAVELTPTLIVFEPIAVALKPAATAAVPTAVLPALLSTKPAAKPFTQFTSLASNETAVAWPPKATEFSP